MKITLNQTEMELAAIAGMGRMVQNQTNGTNSNGTRKLDPDINGVGGEIAVCKYFNKYPDLTIGPHYRGFDLKVGKTKVDVKTTTYLPGYLQSKTNKTKKDCDVFILVHAKFPDFTILGGIQSEEFLQPWNIKDMGYGDKYILEHATLKPLQQIFVR